MRTLLVVLAPVGCGGPDALSVAGLWHLTEAFADDIHLVSCVGEGTMTLAQETVGHDVNGPTEPSSALTGTSGIDTDCVGQDGPFTYFGDGQITQGTISASPENTVTWDAMVNDAQCQYVGTATGDDGYGTDMSGTLTCTLDVVTVVFSFAGEWSAHNWRSRWCETRRELPACVQAE